MVRAELLERPVQYTSLLMGGFAGRVTIPSVYLRFESGIVSFDKMKCVETEHYILEGVIPLETFEDGWTKCSIDLFHKRPNHD